MAVSNVCVVEVGGASTQTGAWLLLWEEGVSVHPINRRTQVLRMELSMLSQHGNRSFRSAAAMLEASGKLAGN